MKGKLPIGLIFVFLIFLIFANGCSVQEAQKDANVIKLAALVSMSGELGSKGEIRKLAIDKGVEDANKNWEEEGLDLQFDLTVEDSQSDPEIALEKAKQLWDEGYEIFIAGSSAEIEKLQPWATENGAIVISYSSSSPTLAIAGDGVFRMVPDDTQQAAALASLLEYEGMYGIVPVYRDDIYGREFIKMLTEEFESLHGTVSDPVPYPSQATDWGLVLEHISESVEDLQFEPEQIAVVLISFDEAANMLEHSEKFPNLNEVRWFGSDSVTLSPIILEDKQIAEKASQVNLTGVTFGIPDTAMSHSIQGELEAFADGAILPDAIYAYDIPGMLASVMNQLEDPFNHQELKNYMIEGSATYAGVTGWTLFNEEGDRKFFHYDIWEVQNEGEDVYAWKQTAKYLRNPSSPGYISPN